MLNKITLMGRISTDLEVKFTPSGKEVLTFNVAVDRSYTPKGAERVTDFFRCVAWGQTAVFISKYFAKGRMIALLGNLRNHTYTDKNGIERLVTEIYVDEVSFTGERSEKNEAATSEAAEVAEQTATRVQPVKTGKTSHDKDYEPTPETPPLLDAGYQEREDDLASYTDGVPF